MYAISKKPEPDRSFPMEGWLSVIGVMLSASVAAWILFSPWLFLLQLVFLLIAFLLTSLGGTYVLKSPPSWLWIGLIVFAFCMMDFSVSRGAVQAGGFSVQSVFKGLVWIIVAVFGIYHGRVNIFSNFSLEAFFSYTLFAVISATYSPSIGLAIGSGIALIALSSYAGVIAGWPLQRVHDLWRILFICIFIMALVSAILGFALPDLSKDYISGVGTGRLMGVTGSANSLGAILGMGSIAGLYCISTARTKFKKIIYLVLLCCVLGVLAWTNSRASIVGLLSSYALLAMFSSIPWLVVGLFSVSIIVWLLLQPELIQDMLRLFAGIASRTGSVADITTFNGRDDIWTAVYQKWLEQPWFGYGLASPRVVISQLPVSQWASYEESHNALLESLLSFGVIGTALLLLFIISLTVGLFNLRNCLKKTVINGNSESILDTCLIRCVLFLIIYGLMDKAYAGVTSPGTIMFALVVGSYVALVRDGLKNGKAEEVSNNATVLNLSPGGR